MKIDPQELSTAKLHAYLLGAVVPRPIAFASTIDSSGSVNLAPFSYFNVFSAHPPILVFSPANRGRDNTTKHTLDNVLEVPEVVINLVNYPIVEQMSLASTEYPKGVNEFVKSGLTPVPAGKIKPPRVKESPVSFECKVLEVKSLGNQGGAGNLVICEVMLIHLDDQILDKEGGIDPRKLNAVARMGGNYYCHANEASIFEIPKPLTTLGIGMDQVPLSIKESSILTGNNLGRLANVESLPSKEEVLEYGKRAEVKKIVLTDTADEALHEMAKSTLEKENVKEAWLILLQNITAW